MFERGASFIITLDLLQIHLFSTHAWGSFFAPTLATVCSQASRPDHPKGGRAT